jgi:CubicO group peptidase (beta-lactamase class C family)
MRAVSSRPLPLLALLLLALLAGACASTGALPSDSAPDGPWTQWPAAEAAGYDAGLLDTARAHADEARSGAVMVVEEGRVVAAWGDVERKLELHSVRKSLYAALYGVAVERGLIDLDATLAELGIDDLAGLSDEEKGATVEHLLTARSGVYLPAAYAPSDQDEERPERGSHPPGTHWFYNNWDFNLSAVLLERAAGRPIGELFDEWIARPIGMEDFEPGDVFEAWEPRASRHPALTFRMSARDLARFGQLWLQDGVWTGERVLPEGWVERASAPASDLGTGEGYGMMWWVYGPGYLPADRYPHAGRLERIVQGRGTGGQVVQVVPDLDMVYVHRGDTDHGREVPGRDAWGIFEQVLAARAANPSEADPSAGAMPLAPVALESQLPPLDWPAPVALSAAERERLAGSYEIAPGVAAEVYEHPDHPGRLFGFFPGKGEAELFALSPTELFVRVQAGVRLHFEPEAGRARFVIGGQEIPARKVSD